MVIADPVAELLGLITAVGDPAPSDATPAARAQAALLRRRFGLALPPPFAGAPSPGEPVRMATALDGPAIAAVKWRAFGTSYRGILPDAFLDQRDLVPPVSFWIGRAMVPPSRRHRLLVWGRPGTVFGYVDLGPIHPEDRDRTTDPDPADDIGTEPLGEVPEPERLCGGAAGSGDDGGCSPRHQPRRRDRVERWSDAADDTGEVYELYVDPSAQGRGGGTALLAAAEDWLLGAGFGRAELSVLAPNARARAFYASRGWEPTGRVIAVDLGTVAFDEVRMARSVERPVGW